MEKVVKEARKIFLDYMKNKSILVRMEENNFTSLAIKSAFDHRKMQKIKCYVNLFEYILSSLPEHKAAFLKNIFFSGKKEKDFKIPRSSYYFKLRSYSELFLRLYY